MVSMVGVVKPRCGRDRFDLVSGIAWEDDRWGSVILSINGYDVVGGLWILLPDPRCCDSWGSGCRSRTSDQVVFGIGSGCDDTFNLSVVDDLDGVVLDRLSVVDNDLVVDSSGLLVAGFSSLMGGAYWLSSTAVASCGDGDSCWVSRRANWL